MTTVIGLVENPVLDKIQSFLNDSLYQELTQNTAKYNIAIRKDRMYRQPYIDGQTGVAQRHCNLFLSDKQRMPGILQGQVYTYPARRWRSKHRSYLASFMQATKAEPEEHTITTVENPAAIIAPPPVIPEEVTMTLEKPLLKEQWAYYEENAFEEDIDEDFESEEDFDDETYNRKGNKKRKAPGRKPKPKPKKKVVLKAPARLLRSIKKDENDTENKPYVCELCGMRYKTRPGLTYHYAHSHRDEDDTETPSKAAATPTKPIAPVEQMVPSEGLPLPHIPIQQMPSPKSWPESNGIPRPGTNNRRPPAPVNIREPAPLPPVTPAMVIPATPVIPPVVNEPMPLVEKSDGIVKKTINPSPYCDFCLGDSNQNKKTGLSEQLVSCADCGRSGHPSCLQFTDNMMKSVLRYRWQCIECKTCTLCGTSENDDQLLFCDDCDRGYHLYCLTPPLSEPPEGEWSCYLCIKEFHNNK
ncbi:Zinc finger protein DPF3 [Armadillidium vulgare]|nr:Zinc finger protein DPF3 [Armadillidium vulgare]